MSLPSFEQLRALIATGDFGRAAASLPKTADPHVRFALDASYWLSGGKAQELSIDMVSRVPADSDALCAYGWICELGLLHSLATFRAQAQYAWLERHRAVVSFEDPRTRLGLELAEGMWAFQEHRDEEACRRLEDCVGRARELREPMGNALSLTLTALVMLGVGQIERASHFARLGSRVAHSDAIPQQEHLAHLVLARTRRYAGAPYLSAHILSSLSKYTAPWLQPWLRWELAFAGSEVPIHEAARSINPVVDGQLRLFSALREGDFAATRGGFTRLYEKVTTRSHVDELRDLHAAIDDQLEPASLGMRQWLVGEQHSLPGTVHAFVRGTQSAHVPRIAWVGFRPGRGGRRILGQAVAHDSGTWQKIVGDDNPQERTLSACAMLLCEPRAISLEQFFHSLYGFEYVSKKHRTILDTLVFRIRELLPNELSLIRQDASLRLESSICVAVPDPRVAPAVEDRLLQLFAIGGPATAKETADKLGLPLRTVQRALKTLSDSGACIGRRDGRTIVYAVEDTTFHEPTQSGY